MTRDSAFDGLGMSASEAESYIPGEVSLEEKLAAAAAACNPDDKWQRGPILLTLGAAARHEGWRFDHNAFLEAYVAALDCQSPEGREMHLDPFLGTLLQTLYDAGRNDFMLSIDGWEPERIAAELEGTPGRKLELTYRGIVGSFGCGSQYCSFTLQGNATYAGAGSNYCEYDLGDSKAMVGYSSFGCRFRIRSPHQINPPPGSLSHALFVLRNHDGMRMPLDCAFHVKEMGELDAKGIEADISRRIWKNVVLGRYKNILVREDDKPSPGEGEP